MGVMTVQTDLSESYRANTILVESVEDLVMFNVKQEYKKKTLL